MITQGKGNQEETIQVSPETVKIEILRFRDELFSIINHDQQIAFSNTIKPLYAVLIYQS